MIIIWCNRNRRIWYNNNNNLWHLIVSFTLQSVKYACHISAKNKHLPNSEFRVPSFEFRSPGLACEPHESVGRESVAPPNWWRPLVLLENAEAGGNLRSQSASSNSERLPAVRLAALEGSAGLPHPGVAARRHAHTYTRAHASVQRRVQRYRVHAVYPVYYTQDWSWVERIAKYRGTRRCRYQTFTKYRGIDWWPDTFFWITTIEFSIYRIRPN